MKASLKPQEPPLTVERVESLLFALERGWRVPKWIQIAIDTGRLEVLIKDREMKVVGQVARRGDFIFLKEDEIGILTGKEFKERYEIEEEN